MENSIITDHRQIDGLLKDIDVAATKAINGGYRFRVSYEEVLISGQQVKALNLWCRQCGEALNAAGLFRTMPLSGKKRRWVRDDFKEHIYKPFLKTYTGKSSTMIQNTVEPSDIYLALSSHIHQEHGVQMPEWPGC